MVYLPLQLPEVNYVLLIHYPNTLPARLGHHIQQEAYQPLLESE